MFNYIFTKKCLIVNKPSLRYIRLNIIFASEIAIYSNIIVVA